MLRNLILISLVSWVSLSALQAAEPIRPNILWLVAEDFGPALGCYGNKVVSTPNLDQLARDGVLYTRFYTTAPVCSPSRSAFMTGMYATTLGAHQHRTKNKPALPDGVRVLSDWLREAGYFTANVVQLPPALKFRGTGKTDWNFLYPGKAFDSKDWGELKGHQPFYAQLNFNETHRKFHAPAKVDPAKVVLPPYYPDHPITRQDYAAYLDSAIDLDQKIGLILAQLEADGLADNTIVIFFGDNGEAHVRGKQFCYEEGLHVPLIIRWPKALPPPVGFEKAGTRDHSLLEAIDLTATTITLTGAKKPAGMQGRVFLGAGLEPDRQLVFGARDRCDLTAMRLRTVRDSRYRYIRNFTPEIPFLAPSNYKETQYPVWNLLKQLHAEGSLTPAQEFLCQAQQPAEELYDLQTDPDEIRNLATSENPEHQVVLKKLRKAVERWVEETGDRGRLPDPDQN